MSSDLASSAQGAPTRRGLSAATDTSAPVPAPASRRRGQRVTEPAAVAGAPAPDPAAVLWERERLLEERERIAADLHDHVVGRLFAAALNLERVVGTLGPGPLAAQLEVTVDGLDDTIFQLRRMIGRLKQQTASVGDRAGAALAVRLLNVMTEMSPALGFDPDLRLTGLDVPLPEDIDEDLLAVLREALTNVARHAQAGGAKVEVAATVDRLTVNVTDDGTGIDAAPAFRGGLDNLARRAHDRHGTFSAEAVHRSGTRVTSTSTLLHSGAPGTVAAGPATSPTDFPARWFRGRHRRDPDLEPLDRAEPDHRAVPAAAHRARRRNGPLSCPDLTLLRRNHVGGAFVRRPAGAPTPVTGNGGLTPSAVTPLRLPAAGRTGPPARRPGSPARSGRRSGRRSR